MSKPAATGCDKKSGPKLTADEELQLINPKYPIEPLSMSYLRPKFSPGARDICFTIDRHKLCLYLDSKSVAVK